MAQPRWRPEHLSRLRSLARSADLVVAHGSTTLPASALALFGSTPFVYVSIGDPRAWQTTAVRRWRSRLLLARSRAVVAIAQRSAQSVHDLLGVPRDRVRIIPNFRSSGRFRPLPQAERLAVRASYGVPSDAPLVVFLGSMTQEKRPDLAIDAVSSLSGVHLVVAGSGILEPDVRERAARVDGGRIRVVGSVTEPERLLAAADALVLSSDTEGVPGVLIEAGLCGIPAAATSVGFVDEVVVEGRTGRLAPAGDVGGLAKALAGVLADSGRYGSAARAHCLERFDEEHVVSQWEDFLTSVTGGWR